MNVKGLIAISIGVIGAAGAGAFYYLQDDQIQVRGANIASGPGPEGEGPGCGRSQAGDSSAGCEQEEKP
jgi:hypothetical protein